jgi:hypothetical protein
VLADLDLRPVRRARTFSSANTRCSAKNLARSPDCEAPLSTRSAMGFSYFGLSTVRAKSMYSRLEKQYKWLSYK